MNLLLLRKESMEGDVVSFVFDPPSGFTWSAGQYMKVTLPHDNPDNRGIERWFTIAAPPYEKSPRITTRIFKDRPSSFKSALNKLEPGDPLEVELPGGDFILGDGGEDLVFIAAGVGITPFHAILSDLDHDGEMPNILFLYGVTMDDPLFHRELGGLASKYPSLKVQYLVDPARVDEEAIRKFVPDTKSPHYFVSGPEPMVNSVHKILLDLGVSAGNIEVDHFSGYTWPLVSS
jgi:ferredoxin-NADP reductase